MSLSCVFGACPQGSDNGSIKSSESSGSIVSESSEPAKGVWYYSSPIRMDHMTVSMAPRGQARQHQQLYLHVLGRGRRIKTSHVDLQSLVHRSHCDLVTLARLPREFRQPSVPSRSPSISPGADSWVQLSEDREDRTVGDWCITPPLNVETFARAESFSDLFGLSSSGKARGSSSLSEDDDDFFIGDASLDKGLRKRKRGRARVRNKTLDVGLFFFVILPFNCLYERFKV